MNDGGSHVHLIGWARRGLRLRHGRSRRRLRSSGARRWRCCSRRWRYCSRRWRWRWRCCALQAERCHALLAARDDFGAVRNPAPRRLLDLECARATCPELRHELFRALLHRRRRRFVILPPGARERRQPFGNHLRPGRRRPGWERRACCRRRRLGPTHAALLSEQKPEQPEKHRRSVHDSPFPAPPAPLLAFGAALRMRPPRNACIIASPRPPEPVSPALVAISSARSYASAI